MIEFADELQKSNIKFYKKFSEKAAILKQKYRDNHYIDPQTTNDNFSGELVHLLCEEVYQIKNGMSDIIEEDINDA